MESNFKLYHWEKSGAHTKLILMDSALNLATFLLYKFYDLMLDILMSKFVILLVLTDKTTVSNDLKKKKTHFGKLLKKCNGHFINLSHIEK